MDVHQHGQRPQLNDWPHLGGLLSAQPVGVVVMVTVLPEPSGLMFPTRS
jgi:hypothetical protein